VPVLGIIENMSFFICRHCGEREEIFGHGRWPQDAELLGVPFLARSRSTRSCRRRDSGEPIVVLDPTSAAAQAFRQLAADGCRAGGVGTRGSYARSR